MSTAERILELAGKLTPEETAAVAGELLCLSGCSRDNIQIFRKALGAEGWEELAARIDDPLEGDED